jgi:hypothetical protein
MSSIDSAWTSNLINLGVDGQQDQQQYASDINPHIASLAKFIHDNNIPFASGNSFDFHYELSDSGQIKVSGNDTDWIELSPDGYTEAAKKEQLQGIINGIWSATHKGMPQVPQIFATPPSSPPPEVSGAFSPPPPVHTLHAPPPLQNDLIEELQERNRQLSEELAHYREQAESMHALLGDHPLQSASHLLTTNAQLEALNRALGLPIDADPNFHVGQITRELELLKERGGDPASTAKLTAIEEAFGTIEADDIQAKLEAMQKKVDDAEHHATSVTAGHRQIIERINSALEGIPGDTITTKITNLRRDKETSDRAAARFATIQSTVGGSDHEVAENVRQLKSQVEQIPGLEATIESQAAIIERTNTRLRELEQDMHLLEQIHDDSLDMAVQDDHEARSFAQRVLDKYTKTKKQLATAQSKLETNEEELAQLRAALAASVPKREVETLVHTMQADIERARHLLDETKVAHAREVQEIRASHGDAIEKINSAIARLRENKDLYVFVDPDTPTTISGATNALLHHAHEMQEAYRAGKEKEAALSQELREAKVNLHSLEGVQKGERAVATGRIKELERQSKRAEEALRAFLDLEELPEPQEIDQLAAQIAELKLISARIATPSVEKRLGALEERARALPIDREEELQQEIRTLSTDLIELKTFLESMDNPQKGVIARLRIAGEALLSAENKALAKEDFTTKLQAVAENLLAVRHLLKKERTGREQDRAAHETERYTMMYEHAKQEEGLRNLQRYAALGEELAERQAKLLRDDVSTLEKQAIVDTRKLQSARRGLSNARHHYRETLALLQKKEKLSADAVESLLKYDEMRATLADTQAELARLEDERGNPLLVSA